MPIKPLHKMSKEQILKEFPPNGFKLVEQFDELPWQHVMFFQRDDAPKEWNATAKVGTEESVIKHVWGWSFLAMQFVGGLVLSGTGGITGGINPPARYHSARASIAEQFSRVLDQQPADLRLVEAERVA